MTVNVDVEGQFLCLVVLKLVLHFVFLFLNF